MNKLALSCWLLTGALVLGALAARAQAPEALQASTPPEHAVWLDSLDVSKIRQGWGDPRAGRSVEGHALRVGGTTFVHGVGTHARSEMRIDLHGAATRFASIVGVDDETDGKGSVVFFVIADGKVRARSRVLRGGQKPELLSADLTGARRLVLRVTDAGDGMDSDHADWAGAALTLAADTAARPVAVAVPQAPNEPARMVIPPPDPRPALHGPRIVGATPGRPFLFLIPATGDGPLTYSARKLPAGLRLDSQTGIISGALRESGTTVVTLTVKGARGTARRSLTIVAGEHKLALTPPMGWNSWNVWAGEVDSEKVRAAADAMVSSGLAAHGYQYVNIDDTWEGGRDAQGMIETNRKFPDMRALAEYVHSRGLKIGIYSSPGPKTCAGFEASYRHEDQDARRYAQWGMDYLKYDWCSYGEIARGDHSLAAFQKPYRVMRASLDRADRDIVYSLCQYGMGDVWKWGAEVGGNCWRTTGDINDHWDSVHGIYESQNGHEKYAGPGHWNDPDMLVVGRLGWGNPHPTNLTPNEQLTHISLWCLLSSPLLIGCDMTKLDSLTHALLTNDEALEINQDPLGKPAGKVADDGDGGEVWARPLADGTHAVGLVNSGDEKRTVTVRWSDLGLSGRQPVRDLWLHQDVGSFDGSYAVEVPVHGTVLLKVGRPAHAG